MYIYSHPVILDAQLGTKHGFQCLHFKICQTLHVACLQGGGFRQATPEEMSNMFSNMFGEGGGGGGFAGFADLFAQQQRQAQMRGPDVQAQMRITLREAAEGVKKTLHIPIRSIHGKRETRKVEVDIPAGEQQICRLMFV